MRSGLGLSVNVQRLNIYEVNSVSAVLDHLAGMPGKSIVVLDGTVTLADVNGDALGLAVWDASDEAWKFEAAEA